MTTSLRGEQHIKHLCDCYHNAQYVSLMCLLIGLTAVLVILAAFLGADMVREWLRLRRIEGEVKPKRP